jgi:hypothetical protein
VPPIPFSFCDFCGRLVHPRDIEQWHRDVVAPFKALEEERLEWALREV